MSRALGVIGACAVLIVAGCGGVAELDSDEIETVSQARSAVEAAAANESLNPDDEKTLEELMILCREKPLAETGGDSMREIMSELAAKLESADPAFSKRMQRVATRGCD